MSFNKILELLYNSKEAPLTNFNNAFSKFNPEIIDNISGNIADLIYNSFNEKSTQKRLDVIEFLRTICCENTAHFKVDETNCLPILRTFFQDFIIGDTQLQLFLNDVRKECSLNKPPTSAVQIRNYYQIKSRRELELSSKREQYKLEMEKRMPADFKFNFSTNVKINYDQIRDIFGQIEVVKLNIEHRRESRITVGYSLLNINDDKHIIKQILNELCQYDKLYDFENDFLTHLFESTELLNMDILTKFPFIYEIAMIKLCTKLIPINKQEELLMQLLLEKPYGKIFNIIQSNPMFKASIIDICSTLFVLSNFNTGILYLINYLAK